MYRILPVIEKAVNLLPVYPITLGSCRKQLPIKRPKGAVFHHLMHISEGDALFLFNGKRVVIKQGSTVFIKKNFPVEYEAYGNSLKTSWVTFDGSSCENIFEYFAIGDYAVYFYGNMLNKTSEILRLADKGEAAEELSCKTYELIVEYFTGLKSANNSPMLKMAKEFIRQYYYEDLAVNDIAKAVKISQSLLFRLFREEGTTPVEYLRSVRIDNAKNMLLNGREKVFDIARKCGFSDVAYFCKVFKEKTGVSPLSYRNKFEA